MKDSLRFVLLGSAVTLAALRAGPAVQAGEGIFNYLYTTDLVPRGRAEFEQSVQGKFGKWQGDYTNVLFRTEYEYGITDNLQVALYLNNRHVSAAADNRDGTTGGEDVPASADPLRRYRSWRFESVSAEFICRVLSPYRHPIGVALYLEPGYGPREREIETRLIVQKNFLDDQLIWAANVMVEWEWEEVVANPFATPGSEEALAHPERDMMLDLTTGVSYRFAPRWSAGLEFRNHNEFASHNFSAQEHTAFFLGPNLHYATKRWWATLLVLPQLPIGRAFSDEQKSAAFRHGLIFGDEHERIEIRLKAGFSF
jgi:hypothetical protein